MRKVVSLATLVAILGYQATLLADMLPSYSVDEMCDMADLIVEGDWLGNDAIRIDRIYKGASFLEGGARTVAVSRLGAHSKVPWHGANVGEGPLRANRAVLFLDRDKTTGEWRSISTDADNEFGFCGSCGLFWVDGTAAYGYEQSRNPGPYEIVSASRRGGRVPKSAEALRADIESGLANSREWRRSLALPGRVEKARALARYLLKSTSPPGDKGSYLYAVRRPLASLGEDAIPSLIRVLRTAPAGERLDPTVLILYDIGPAAAQAIPDLIDLLPGPERAFTGYVLSALGATGDPTALPALEGYIKSNDERLASDATKAIAMLKDRRARALQK